MTDILNFIEADGQNRAANGNHANGGIAVGHECFPLLCMLVIDSSLDIRYENMEWIHLVDCVALSSAAAL